MPGEGNAEVQAGLPGHEVAQGKEHAQYVPWRSMSSPTWEQDDDDKMFKRELVFAARGNKVTIATNRAPRGALRDPRKGLPSFLLTALIGSHLFFTE